jgi:putative intracellular protease/amidase
VVELAPCSDNFGACLQFCHSESGDELLYVGANIRDNTDLHDAICAFYVAEKSVAAFCHGVGALVDATLSDGSYLVTGKTVTGFANVEEDYSDQAAGTRVMSWRLEDALKERDANYVQAGLFKPFAIRDGRLITGQQQYSGRKVSQMLIAALGQ